MEVKVKKLHPNAKLPTRGSEEAACWDLYAYSVEKDGWILKVHTGLIMEIPKGYFLDIRPRSGLSLKGLRILNSPGTIDSDYRGEIIALVTIPYVGLKLPFEVGDRVAQIRLEKVIPTEFKEVKVLSGTKRGEGGFGSTGN
jgi:dUTP pyrophosphatase